MMNIGLIGTGYVGLVTGCCLAETGNKVLCMDIEAEKVKRMQGGEVPIYEPGLERIFLKNQKQGRLSFTNSLEEVVRHADILFFTLPTPNNADNFADLRSVIETAEKTGVYMDRYKIIVNKSTVPVGTSEKIKKVLTASVKIPFDVVSNPEFLREGYAVEDFMKPDRIVIGTSSAQAKEILSSLYAPYTRQGNLILFMDERSAELTKYAANAFLATKISFMNEMALLCEKVGANIDMLRKGMGTDERIGRDFLFAGIGYGGSCFPKDVQALYTTSKEAQLKLHIIEAVLTVNQRQRQFFLDKITAHFKGEIKGKNLAFWGLSFKPNTDDIREAPSLWLIDQLLALGAHICAYDPEAMTAVEKKYGTRIRFAKDMYTPAQGADALVICTEWPEFRTPDWTALSRNLRTLTIFDGRNLFDPKLMRKQGYIYKSIGREDMV